MLIFKSHARADGQFRRHVNFVLAKKPEVLHIAVPQGIAKRLRVGIPVLAVYSIAEIEREGIDVRVRKSPKLISALDIVVFGMCPVNAKFKGVLAEGQSVGVGKLEAELARMQPRIRCCVSDVAQTSRRN